MKIYKDLIINGSREDLRIFEESLKILENENWSYSGTEKNFPDYLRIIYTGKTFPMSGLSILKGDLEDEVANIVPLTQNQLSYDEYNGILNLFYDDFLKTYAKSEITVSFNEKDEISLKDILKDETIVSLKTFSDCANKSTGSIHPLDRKRWFDFICLAYKNNDYTKLSESYLEAFLVEEFSWSQKWASKLASEYYFGINLLKHWEN